MIAWGGHQRCRRGRLGDDGHDLVLSGTGVPTGPGFIARQNLPLPAAMIAIMPNRPDAQGGRQTSWSPAEGRISVRTNPGGDAVRFEVSWRSYPGFVLRRNPGTPLPARSRSRGTPGWVPLSLYDSLWHPNQIIDTSAALGIIRKSMPP